MSRPTCTKSSLSRKPELTTLRLMVPQAIPHNEKQPIAQPMVEFAWHET